jgi:tetratricopeptide (TPR) repeat protein
VRGALASLLALGALTAAPPASAQQADPAVARALFEEGTKALEKGDWDGACPKFEASFASKPTVSALANIGKCHEHAGKLTLAADDFQRALSLNEDTLSQSRKKELAAYTGDLLKAVQARIPKLRIVAKDAPAGLQITRDGTPLAATALGIGLPVDPGEHVIVASAPGRKTSTTKVALAEKTEIEVAVVLVADDAALPPRADAPPLPPPTPTPPPAPESHRGTPAWAWVTGAVGLAAGGAAHNDAVDGGGATCGGPCYDSKFNQAQVDSLNSRRHRDLGAGIALGAVGVAGIAVGAWGIASAPRAPAQSAFVVQPWLSAERSGLALTGGF